MAERRSSLAAVATAAIQDAPAALREVRPGAMVQVTAWPETLAAVESVITTISGTPPPRIGGGYSDGSISIAAVSPGRYFVSSTAPDLAPRFASALAATEGAVTDISHGYAIFRLEGIAAEALLARCIAIDLDAAAFPPGRVARTPIHHIDVLLHRLSVTAFDLWVSRSFAESLAEWILDAGAEFPTAFGGVRPSPASQTDMPPA